VGSIAGGDFGARIALPVGGELGELLNGFNAMASQLEAYNEANIEELTAAQVKQQTLIATMADGALLLDGAGKIVLVNPTARRLFRWEGRNLEGSELCDELPALLAVELQPPSTPCRAARKTAAICASSWASRPAPCGSCCNRCAMSVAKASRESP
jgi:two-component system sensor histidine kinase NblS